MEPNPNPINPPNYVPTAYPNGIYTPFNGLTSVPGLEIVGISGSALVNNAELFTLIQGDSASYVPQHSTFPVLSGGNLAFDNGSQPVTTPSCRMYTFLATVNYATSAVTLSVVNGADFSKHAPMHPSINISYGIAPQSSICVVGYLYVKNESNAVFIPGTTHLDATGITATFTDGYGYSIWIPRLPGTTE